jgi:hypothetical protein
MKKAVFILFSTMLCAVIFGQDKPLWLEADFRNAQFPKQAFLTGYAEGNVNAGEQPEKAIERIRTTAQSNLLENLRVVIKSNTRSEISSVSSNNRYDEYEALLSSAEKSAAAEITGMNVESYFDKKNNYIFAFAHVNRYELIGYYKANLSLQLQQAEGAMQTGEQLEAAGEKAKARKQCEEAALLFDKIHSTQDLLTTLDGTASPEALQVPKTENMRSTLAQMQARLAQGVYVYVESSEDLFGANADIVAGKVKAGLALKGCSFVEDETQADFRLRLNVSTRLLSNSGSIVFCYVDATVELYDVRKQKTVYTDNLSQKGGSNSQDKAGRKAMTDIAPKITEKIAPWVE